MPLNTGEKFAGYLIQRLLGTGGMGEVYLAQHPRLPRQDALKILSPTSTADTFAHEQGLVHRDVKPENILVTASGRRRRRVLLTDFGIARRIDDVSNLTDDNVAVEPSAIWRPSNSAARRSTAGQINMRWLPPLFTY